MADLDKIKRNVAKMAAQGAPTEHIDGYILSEGATVDAVKAHKLTSPDDAEDARRRKDFFESPEQRQRAEVADARVARERAGRSPAANRARDTVIQFAQGTPVGSWLDELNSGVADLQHRAGMGGEPYQDRMDYHAARERAETANSVKLGKVPWTDIDVTSGGLASIAGGVASAPVTPMLRPFRGGAMFPQMGNALATGSAYGAGYGAGMGQGMERGQNALMGGALGGAVGLAAPVLSGGLGYGYNALMQRGRPMPAELAGIERRAAGLVSEDMIAGGMANPNSPNFYPRQAQRLGPEGTLMDMSRSTEQAGMGVAASGGGGSELVAQTLRNRREFAPDRITRQVDAALGPPVNVPEFIDTARQTFGRQAAPLYEQFHSTMIRTTPELDALLARAQASGAYDEAARIMQVRGIDPNAAQNNGLFIDLIKQGADARAEAAAAAGNRSLARDYRELARGIRTETDAILSPGDPGNSVWAQARRIAGEGKGLEDAIEEGRGVFQRNMTPDQLRANMQGNSQLENEGVMMGAREAVRSDMGAAATQFRATPDNAARRLLNSNDAREKLAMVAGPREARDVGRRIDIENRFAETENRVLANSVTAERQAARERYRGPSDRADPARLRGMTLTGAALEGVNRIGNALLRGAIDEARLRALLDSARLLSAQGPVREQFAQGLLAYGQQNARTQAQARLFERAARLLIEGSRGTAISAATAAE